MSTTTELTENMQDGILKAIEVGQRLTVEALSLVASNLGSVLPDVPPVPFAALVTPQETIDAAFRFAERLLSSQKAFMTELVTIATPTSEPSPKKAAA